MSLFALTETSAGYALFKAKDKKLLKNGNIADLTKTAQDVANVLKLKKFVKYDGAQTAVEESVSIGEGKVSPMLEKLLESIKDEKKASLAVADPKLANGINKLSKFQIIPISDSSTEDLFRAIREHFMELVPGVTANDINAMSLGLAHSVSRHKLKFSPEKLDTMIIQAIALLDDLDKELNTYAMRTREWYGWHFPELAKILNDNFAYARVILKVGYRKDASSADLAEILPEELETAVKNAAEVSMGVEISPEDLDHIKGMANQVVEFTEFRLQLSTYLGARMQAIAPNLTHLVGELVGARLIAHSGSLLNLAKSPASTIQILGAEKALFRALKTKHDTPKYGLIYHASLVGQATGKNKGKIARMLSTKTALGLRIDSLADWGVEGEGIKEEPSDEDKIRVSSFNRVKLERQLRAMEGKPLGPRGGVTIGPNGQAQAQPEKWNLKEARKYNPNADGLASTSAPREGAKLIEEIEDVDMADAASSSDESDEPATNGLTNGALASSKKAEKEKHKAEKAARKAERAAKREARAAKKAAKEAAKATKTNGVTSDAEKKDKKKRKHEDEPKSSEKKKKHKA